MSNGNLFVWEDFMSCCMIHLDMPILITCFILKLNILRLKRKENEYNF